MNDDPSPVPTYGPEGGPRAEALIRCCRTCQHFREDLGLSSEVGQCWWRPPGQDRNLNPIVWQGELCASHAPHSDYTALMEQRRREWRKSVLNTQREKEAKPSAILTVREVMRGPDDPSHPRLHPMGEGG